MKFNCVHCGKAFKITAEQLGTRGKCPHCRSTIIIPRTAAPEPSRPAPPAQKPWTEIWFSTTGSILLHLLVLIVLAWIPWGGIVTSRGVEGEQVSIAELPVWQLTELDDRHFEMAVGQQAEAPSWQALAAEMMPVPMLDPLADAVADWQALSPLSAVPAASEADLARRSPLDSAANEDFGHLLRRLQRDGLDIVIVFDSTGSMGREIFEVKNQINRIGQVLFRLVPQTRISIVTYRDVDDEYLVKGISLTDDLGSLVQFLDPIQAAGGGDDPEAVDEGLAWAIENNQFRPQARKVILLFGDAPPHHFRRARCLKLAGEFRLLHSGVVHTITCRASQPLPDFVDIARLGGGQAFTIRDERELMASLMVLVFGSEHEEKVLEAFQLLRSPGLPRSPR